VANAELKTADVTRTPVGTGRFRFAKWEPGVRVEVIADTANYRGRPKLDRVVWMLAQAPTSAAPALLSGQIDFYSAYPIDQADHLDSAAPIRTLPYEQNGYSYLAMNLFARKSNRPHPILSDINVRKAISMALDRKGMLANVFKGSALLANGPFPTGALLSDTTLGVPGYDTTAAKAALDAAGWKVGANGIRTKNGMPLKLDLLTPVSSIPRVRYADLIQEQLRKVGIDVEVSKETANFGPRLFGSDFDLALQNFNTDPTVTGIAQAWTKDGLGGFNISKYQSPVVEAHLKEAAAAKDLQGVKMHTSQAFRQIVADVPAVWLYSAMTVAAANKRIELAPFSREGWWVHMADWSIPASKRIDRDKIGLGAAKP
jgi:peptide/nickel transport system substrate-binding protein